MQSPASFSGPRLTRVDLVVALALLVGSGVWATRFWNFFVAHGGQPSFYQAVFEPAVMIACGKGFVVASTPQPPALADFLERRRDAFDCREIPPTLKLGRENLYQGTWRYLLVTVGWAWRVLGISWSGMGPLFGLFFGVTIALAYGIFRLGMGPPLALAGASGLTISSLHLINLPHLRDYAKAPFMLALMLILGLLVKWPVRRRTMLALAAAYGAVLGIGYGFRTDFLVNLPAIGIVLFACLGGGITKNLALKAAAAALAVATFVVVSWPVTSLVYSGGGCQWHVVLLGLQSRFDRELHVAPAQYDFGYAYSDSYVFHTVSSYARRTPQGLERLTYCSHQYDVESGAYLEQLVAGFPADFAVRAYASSLRIVELPFHWWGGPIEGWSVPLYRLRGAILRRKPVSYAGVLVVAAAMVLAASASVRVGFCLLFFVLYFGGYPAAQFSDRHYFHLELITWWAGGFIVHQTLMVLRSFWRAPGWRRLDAAVAIGRAAVFIVLATALIVPTMQLARWYQRRQATTLLQAYISAPKRPLPLRATAAGVLQEIAPPAAGDQQPSTWQFATQFLEVDLNEAACGPTPSVTFRYDTVPELDFSRTVTLAGRAESAGPTRIFFAAYEHFRGLEFSDATPGCVTGASRFVDLRALPLLLNATIAPDWERQPLYQRLADWERRWRATAR